MSLKIISGRAGSGKSTYMLNDMPENENTIYVVPEQFSFSAEKMIIKTFGTVGLGNPHVLSFMRLADLIFSKYGSPEFISDTASYEMLVSYCANSITPENLRLFDGLVKKSELSQTASSIITTFKRYCITPQALSAAIEKTDDVLLKKKLGDSLVIYEEYLKELGAANLSDRNDTLTVLANILSDSDCDFLDDKHIYIDQFTDFDPSEYECIKVMLQRARRVTVALCTDGSSQFDTVNRTYNRLISLAEECNIPVEPTTELTQAMYGAKPMIKHLEKCYFDDFSVPFAGDDGSISVFCGKNKFSEIHNVAREIVRLVRDEKLRYRDISIIARNSEEYKGTIDRVFPFYDIPVFADRKTPIAGHSITMFFTAILDIALGGFSYENVFSYIKSPFSPLTRQEADEIENYCLAAGIRPYSWKNPFTIKCGAYNPENSVKRDRYTPEKLLYINSLREKVYLPLSGLITKLRQKSTVCEFCTCLFEFFTEIKLEYKINYYAQQLENNGENLYALQTKQVYNILIEIFNDICAVLGDKILSLREFRNTISVGLQSVEISTIPSSSDCVTLGSIDRIKGHGAKVVFLVGVNSGVFPAHPTESGLFTDEDKHLLAELGIEMPPNLLQMAQSEQLLIYDALTCAGERLYISYAAADNSSNAMIASEIVDRLRGIFPDIKCTDDLLSLPDDISMITSKKAVFDLLAAKIREYRLDSKPLSPAMSAAAGYFSKDKIYSPLLKQAISMTYYTNSVREIDSGLVREVFGNEMKTSISRLETYNKCPFSFFAKYLLKLEPKQNFEVNVSDSGSFLHDFLDSFSVFISTQTDKNGNPYTWKTIDNDFIVLHTPHVLQEILAGVNPHMFELPRIKAMFMRLCRAAQQAAFAIKRHLEKGSFIPLGYEISFDEDGTFKPTKITLANNSTVILRGRIDRADEVVVHNSDGSSGKFVRIVDYKSSDKTVSLSNVYHGLQLQLFVYLSNLCDNGYSPAGILYCNLKDPILKVSSRDSEDDIRTSRESERRMSGIVLDDEEMYTHMGGDSVIGTKKFVNANNFNAMFRHLKRVVKNTAEKIYGGSYPIKCTSDACTWCEYAQLCRFDSAFSGCTMADNEKIKDDEIWQLLEEEDRKEDGLNEVDG